MERDEQRFGREGHRQRRQKTLSWESIDFKFHEGTLVLDAAKLNEERTAETTYVVSFDGKLTNLAWNEDVNVLPSRTPHRSDDLS